MYKVTLEGFPTLGISDRVELPNIAELLQVPLLNKADIDYAYGLGNETLRMLIDKTPLRNDKKYYTVRSQIQFIKPGYCTVNTTQWHTDGFDIPIWYSDDVTHIFVGDSSNTLTQFLEEPVEIEEEYDFRDLGHLAQMDWLEENQFKYNFRPKFIEPNRFITMTCRHPHRVGNTQNKPEFRFFFEIRESDHTVPRPPERSRLACQKVYKGIRGEEFICLEHSKQWGVIIRDKY